MTGTIRTLRPDQEGIDNAGGYAAVSAPVAGSLASATSDDSDTSYIAGIHAGTVSLGVSTYALATTERVLRARVRFRAIGPALGSHTVGVAWNFGNFTDGDWTPDEVANIGAGPTDTVGAWHTQWPTGAEITQAFVNKLQTRFRSNLFSGGTAAFFEQYVDLEVVTQPSVVLTAPTGTNPGATHRPTFAWTPTIHDAQAQKKYWIRVFDKALNPSPVWSNTIGLVSDTGPVASAATSRVSHVTYGNGNFRVLMIVAKDYNGTDWYSQVASIDFTIADNPPVPTQVGPTGTINTGFPLLQAKTTQSALPFSLPVYPEWQVATDIGFTTNVSTFSFTPAQADGGGLHHFQTSGTPFDQTVWFLRARTHDTGGGVSAYSAPISFTVSHQPTAVPLSPLTGDFVDTSVQRYSWEFVAWAPSETQTAYQVQLLDLSGAVLDDTGKVASANQFATMLDPTERPVQWRVRVYDDDDVVSAFSDPITFQIIALAHVALTAPTSPITTYAPTVAWTFSSTVGRTQATWRLRIVDNGDGSTVFDSGIVPDASTSTVITAGVLLSGHNYQFILDVVDSAGTPVETSLASIAVTFPAPGALVGLASETIQVGNRPVLTGKLALDAITIVHLTWDASAIGATFASYDVERYDVNADGTASWNLVEQITNETQNFVYDHECCRAVSTIPVPDITTGYNAHISYAAHRGYNGGTAGVSAGFVTLYRVRTVDAIAGPSDWADFPRVAVATDGDCDLILSSNWTPDLSVAYLDEAPYEFSVDDSANVKSRRVYGAPMPTGFRARGRLGDIFDRTLIVAFNDPNVAGVDSGRALYDPLLDRIRDFASPYVCITDGMGRRWFALVTFNKATYRKVGEQYLAAVTFQEVSLLPVPVVTDLPWIP